MKRRTDLLYQLVEVKEKHSSDDLDEVTESIAYEILSEQAVWRNTRHLHLLRHFVKNDQYLNGDISKYLHISQAKPLIPEFAAQIQLDEEVRWLHAVTISRQYLALGYHESKELVVLARGNWQGHVEYYHWPLLLYPPHIGRFRLVKVGKQQAQIG